MKSSAQLEREAEETRSELARTLDELRGRITPGQLVDEAVDYARETTGGEFFRNLSRQVAANPLPVALIGAGISWLALAKGKPGTADSGAGSRGRAGEWSTAAGDRANEAANRAAEMAGSWSDSITDTADRATSSVADAGTAMGERASSAYESMTEGAASTYESMRSGAADRAGRVGDAAADAYGRFADTAGRTAQSASDAGQRIAGFGSDALAFCKSQPLVLAGLGLALGAVLGAIMPPTDTEDRLMGDTSDRIKEQARGAAEEQIDKVKTTVESGMEQAQTQAEHLTDTVGDPAATSIVPDHDDATAKLPLE